MMQIYEKKIHKPSQNNNKRAIYLSSRWRDLRICIENINFFFIFHQLNFEFRREQINFCFGVACGTD